MVRSKWFYHPIIVFIFSIIALGTSLALYIRWYLQIRGEVEYYIDHFNIGSGKIFDAESWVVILILSILVGIIIVGLFFILVYYQKVIQLYRMQQNFINGFTHELKTPLASIRLFLDTFTKHELQRDDQLKYIDLMKKDTERLTDNVERILHLSKIEDKSYKTDFVEKDLFSFVNEIINNNSHLFGDAEIDVIKNSKYPMVYPINEQLFEMLVMNIVSNAIKYNDSKTPRIEIKFDSNSKWIIISFKDNGIGIDKSERKRVFKKFYQIGTSDNMTAKGKGGLGLYLAWNVVKIHKGRIDVTGYKYDKGSTFRVYLPSKE